MDYESYVVIRWSHGTVFSHQYVPKAVHVPCTAWNMSTDMDPTIGLSIQNAKARNTITISSWVCFCSLRLPLPLDAVHLASVVNSHQYARSSTIPKRIFWREEYILHCFYLPQQRG